MFARTLASPDPAVEVVSGDCIEAMRRLKAMPGDGIWLCGGGALAGTLLPEIDELVRKRYPMAIGSGSRSSAARSRSSRSP